MLPWGPLGAGFLTGKYSRDTDPPEGSRMADAGDDIEEARHRRAIERNFRVVDEAQAIAGERGITRAQTALAWQFTKPTVSAPIIGATKPNHLADAVGALDVALTTDEVARLETPYTPRRAEGFV